MRCVGATELKHAALNSVVVFVLTLLIFLEHNMLQCYLFTKVKVDYVPWTSNTTRNLSIKKKLIDMIYTFYLLGINANLLLIIAS